jgi:hypothetical protein
MHPGRTAMVSTFNAMIPFFGGWCCLAALADGGSRCFVFRFAGVLRQLDWHVDNPIGRRRAPKTKGTRDNPICGCRGGSGFSSSVVAVGCSGCRHPDVGLSTVVWGVRGTSELARRCRYLSGLSTPIWRWRGRPGWWLLPGGSKKCYSRSPREVSFDFQNLSPPYPHVPENHVKGCGTGQKAPIVWD